MITFRAKIQRFGKKGEKTGWSYIVISKTLADKLNPGIKKSFRVKGKLDGHPITNTALLPMGDGKFILAVNAQMRKGTGKKDGDTLTVQFSLDETPFRLSHDFVKCLKDDPAAYEFFQTLTKGHQRYFNSWIESAKTKETRAKRMTMAVIGLAQKQGYGEMIRANKKFRKEF